MAYFHWHLFPPSLLTSLRPFPDYLWSNNQSELLSSCAEFDTPTLPKSNLHLPFFLRKTRPWRRSMGWQVKLGHDEMIRFLLLSTHYSWLKSRFGQNFKRMIRQCAWIFSLTHEWAIELSYFVWTDVNDEFSPTPLGPRLLPIRT